MPYICMDDENQSLCQILNLNFRSYVSIVKAGNSPFHGNDLNASCAGEPEKPPPAPVAANDAIPEGSNTSADSDGGEKYIVCLRGEMMSCERKGI